MVFLPPALALLAFTATVLGSEPVPYQTLPPAPKYQHGAFTSPNTTQNQIYAQGSQMNITWRTDYDSVNIDLIKSLDFNSKVTIATATSQKWVLYNIECIDQQCNLSHHFRLSNAYGDPSQGQVWSGAFWIKPTNDNTPTTSSSASSTPPTSANSTDLPAVSAASSPSPTPSPASSGPNTLALGLGIGLGIGLPFLTLAAALLYFFRRRRSQRGGTYAKAELAEQNNQFHYHGNNSSTTAEARGTGYYSPMEYAKYEGNGAQVSEVPTVERAGELQGSEVPERGGWGK